MKILALWWLLTGCAGPPPSDRTVSALDDDALVTRHTTRLPGSDAEARAIAVSQAAWPCTHPDACPNAVVLARPHAGEAYTAMHALGVFDAPILYLTPSGHLSPRTVREMRRLRPRGVHRDGRVQVYLVGPPAPSVERVVSQQLGYTLRAVPASGPLALADRLDRWRSRLDGHAPRELVISALDDPDAVASGAGALSWNARAGRGFAWVSRDRIPSRTRAMLDRREGPLRLYLAAGPDRISDTVAAELGAWGVVERLAGDDVSAHSVEAARWRDTWAGRGSWRTRRFGWGVTGPGQRFVIASADDPLGLVASAGLRHTGPPLVVPPDAVPDAMRAWLEGVRPVPGGPPNHAIVIGGSDQVSHDTQRDLDALLRPAGAEPADHREDADDGR